jgi:hypothetical protein
MARLAPEHFAVDRFGLLDASVLVQLERARDQ